MMKTFSLSILFTAAVLMSILAIAEPRYDPESQILSLSSVSTPDRAMTFRDIDIKLNADGTFQILGGQEAETEVLYVDELISVYDGDTFTVNIQHLHPLIGENIRIRTYGIDTPEIEGKCEHEIQLARQAQSLAETTLRNAAVIKLTEIQRDNYFRIGAVVYVDGLRFNDIMLNAGLAVPYDPYQKKDWCR